MITLKIYLTYILTLHVYLLTSQNNVRMVEDTVYTSFEYFLTKLMIRNLSFLNAWNNFKGFSKKEISLDIFETSSLQ